MKPTDLATHLTKFLGYYLPEQRNASPNTVKAYRDVFSLLLLYCRDVHGIAPERLCIKHLDAQLLTEFIEHLGKERHCRPSTQNHRLAVIHAFFRYLQIEEPQFLVQCQRILSLPYRRQEKAEVSYLSSNDIQTILSQPDLSTSRGRRDATLLCLLYDTGARVQEIINLDVQDVRLESPAQIRLTGKGRKTRVVPLMKKTGRLLQDYIQEHDLNRPERRCGPLFFNHYGNRLSRSGVRYVLKKHADQARTISPGLLEKISPHTFRHTKAMHILQATYDIFSVQHILGHADISTTRIYTTADMNMKRQALEKAAGLSPTLEPPSWQKNKGLMDWLRSL